MRALWKITILIMATALCLSVGGCAKEKPDWPVPTRSDDPILPTLETSPVVEGTFTPVYATAFEDTIYLSAYPIEKQGEEEPECPARQITTGGSVCCGGQHEKETPITKVVIVEALMPQSTRDWFRGMAALESIEGLEKLKMDKVADMSNMFAGCVKLAAINADGWEVASTAKMTGIFDGCDALVMKPKWYPVD